jgi:hypothetical protein
MILQYGLIYDVTINPGLIGITVTAPSLLIFGLLITQDRGLNKGSFSDEQQNWRRFG